MVVAWPRRIKPDTKVRSQFTHCIDIGPTILEAAGIPEPRVVDGIEQEPMDGTSFLYTLDDPTAPERHTQQYFEMFGSRAIYKDGWWAASNPDRDPVGLVAETIAQVRPGPTGTPTATSAGSSSTCRTTSPRRTTWQPIIRTSSRSCKELLWEEAETQPGAAADGRPVGPLRHPAAACPRSTRFTLHGRRPEHPAGHDPADPRPLVRDRGRLSVPNGGAEGVIVANADFIGGFALWVDEKGLLTHTYSFLGVETYKQTASEPLPHGDVTVKMLFEADEPKPGSGGTVTLWANDKQIGEGRLDHTVPLAFTSYAGMDVGRDNGLVVDLAYEHKAPYAFTGTVKKVVFDLKPHVHDDEHELHRARRAPRGGGGSRGLSTAGARHRGVTRGGSHLAARAPLAETRLRRAGADGPRPVAALRRQ